MSRGERDLFEAGDDVGGCLGQLRILVSPQVRLQRRLKRAGFGVRATAISEFALSGLLPSQEGTP